MFIQITWCCVILIFDFLFRVGAKTGDCDIPLSGALIAPLHCELSNVDDVVTIEPINGAKTFVNGELITKREVLHHVRSNLCVIQLVKNIKMMIFREIVLSSAVITFFA